MSNFCEQVALKESDDGLVLHIGLDSTGVGLFDALFASFSMILVSEVSLTILLVASLDFNHLFIASVMVIVVLPGIFG